jgi:lipopolysaccharide biosynthesis glycosyltransferase
MHVTLSTLLASSSRFLRIYLVNDGYSDSDISRIHKTLAKYSSRYTFKPIQFNPNRFSTLRSFHGNYMTYAKFVLPEVIPEERFVYLDCDLLVYLDIANLFSEDLHGFALGAAGTAEVRWALESEFFRSRGMRDTDLIFNAGVLLVDAAKWRAQGITDECLAFANAHSAEVRSDQTVLNYIFCQKFQPLLDRYNTGIYTRTPRMTAEETRNNIIHFVGAPKPWDLFGKFLHQNSHLFYRALEQTCFKQFRPHQRITLSQVDRSVRLARSYYRSIRSP